MYIRLLWEISLAHKEIFNTMVAQYYNQSMLHTKYCVPFNNVGTLG